MTSKQRHGQWGSGPLNRGRVGRSYLSQMCRRHRPLSDPHRRPGKATRDCPFASARFPAAHSLPGSPARRPCGRESCGPQGRLWTLFSETCGGGGEQGSSLAPLSGMLEGWSVVTAPSVGPGQQPLVADIHTYQPNSVPGPGLGTPGGAHESDGPVPRALGLVATTAKDTGGGGLARSFVKGTSAGIRLLFFSVLLIFNKKCAARFGPEPGWTPAALPAAVSS